MENKNLKIEPHCLCQSADPFPPIQVEGKNKLYAGLMHGNMVAAQSEMTSATHYLYQSWVLKEYKGGAAKTMHEMAKVEMHHLDVFACLVWELGGDPTYSITFWQRKQVWNGSFVPNCKKIYHLMQSNLLVKQDCIARYQRQAAMVQDSCVAAILRRIIQDEQLHVQIFRSFLDDCIC